MKPRPSHFNSKLSATGSPYIEELSSGPAGHFEINGVLQLDDFARFVLVMSVLEHYSQHDCALLLGCSVPEVREARARALNDLAHSPYMDHSQNQIFVQEKKVK